MAAVAMIIISLVILICNAATAPANEQGPSNIFNDKTTGLKYLAISGEALYKPGGTSMKLKLVIQGKPKEAPQTTVLPTTVPGGTTPITSVSGGTPSGTPTTSSSGGTTSGTPTTSAPGGTTSGTPTTSASGGTTTGGGSTIAAPTTQPSGTTKPGAPDEEALRAHNKFRKTHNAPPMKIDKDLSKLAQAWAEKIAKDGDGSHDKNRGNIGENWNIACKPHKKSPAAAVETWYNEVCKPGWDFGQRETMDGAGHFTQVVWKTSTELGFGMAEGKYRNWPCVFHVARYRKPGNYPGRFTKNVEKGSFDKQTYCSTIKN